MARDIRRFLFRAPGTSTSPRSGRTWFFAGIAVFAVLALSVSFALLPPGGGVQAEADDKADPAPVFTAIVPGLATDGKPAPPPKMTTHLIGSSVQGRPIEVFRIGTGPRHVVLVGGIHTGPEEETVVIVRGLRDYYSNNPLQVPAALTLHFVPAVNPDGLVARTRLNARNVDLNRNFPASDWRPDAMGPGGPVSGGAAPLSEPETRALFEYILDTRPEIVVAWHGYAGLIEANDLPAAVTLAKAFASKAGYEYIEEWEYYDITGELIVALGERNIAAFDVELAAGDSAAFQRNLAALRHVLDMLAN